MNGNELYSAYCFNSDENLSQSSLRTDARLQLFGYIHSVFPSMLRRLKQKLMVVITRQAVVITSSYKCSHIIFPIESGEGVFQCAVFSSI